jgi:hypothetical protein
MTAIRRLWEKWRVHRERKDRLNAARSANPPPSGVDPRLDKRRR